MPDSQPPHHHWRIAHSEASLGWGGQEHRILAEMQGFRRRGSEVWLIAPEKSQLYQRADQAGVPVVAQRFDQRILLPFHALNMARWLRQHRIQIVNPHSSRDGWLLTIAARMARVPLIIRSRHFDVPIPNRSLSRLMYKEWSHHIITTSPKITETLTATFDLNPAEISTVSTGVDLERFKAEGPSASLPLPVLPPGTPLIGMITVLRFAKGTQILAEATRILRDEYKLRIHCVIVGEGPHRQRLENTLATLGVADQFTLTGHSEDVPDIMRALDIIAIPSFHEAIPQSGLQALATGIPVVASDVGGIPSIIQHGKTGRLVPMQNAPALAAAIRETLTDRETTQALCAAGRRMIESQHSLEVMLDRVNAIYRQHLGNSAA